MTDFSNRCNLLAELWIDFRDDEDFVGFIESNDLGFPLAYAFANKLANLTDVGETLINETWDLLLEALDIKEDVGFDSLQALFDFAVDPHSELAKPDHKPRP